VWLLGLLYGLGAGKITPKSSRPRFGECSGAAPGVLPLSSRPELWDKILKRIDCFSPKKKRLIQQELGLATKKPGKPKQD
jgi:hypothetical protein